MTPEQKQRAVDLIDVTKTYRLDAEECAMQMAALLQELIDAPEPEPVFTLTVSESGRFMVLATHTYTGQIPSGEHLLYLAPPAEAPADMARDAGRYRWLRRENAKPGLGFYVGDDTDTMPGDITWIGSDLDAAIDSAIAAEKGGA